ncbi:hypothetical protein X777_05118 [Ooceraea biroi]|uniref:Mos1 transposase HTH domain-containing protein n=1 Tax=Ooceraea biroi TaxID=2015173 RepID=A0A026WFW9_OOCBI|nr:hypothetical protein X777_05118 [Ooceraea biroi]
MTKYRKGRNERYARHCGAIYKTREDESRLVSATSETAMYWATNLISSRDLYILESFVCRKWKCRRQRMFTPTCVVLVNSGALQCVSTRQNFSHYLVRGTESRFTNEGTLLKRRDRGPLVTVSEMYEIRKSRYNNDSLFGSFQFLDMLDFASSREDIADSSRAPPPKTSRISENVLEILRSDRCVSARFIEEFTGIPKSTVHQILSEDLGEWTVCARFVLHTLTENQKDTRVDTAKTC